MSRSGHCEESEEGFFRSHGKGFWEGTMESRSCHSTPTRVLVLESLGDASAGLGLN